MFNWFGKNTSGRNTEESDASKQGRDKIQSQSCGKPMAPDPSMKHIPDFNDNRRTQVHSKNGMITRTCKMCGKTFTLPEEVQHWPDICQACRAKYQPVEMITRKCRDCGKTFTFPSSVQRWPKTCPDCQNIPH